MSGPRQDDARLNLTEGELFDVTEPFLLFSHWLKDAEARELNDPNAMTLATVDENGLPDARMVLLKGIDDRGFVFYTNKQSAKGLQLITSKKAALVFHWKSLTRQVRIRGMVEQVSDAQADAYYSTRARESRIGAWASQQSRPLESRFALEKSIALYAAKYAMGVIPRPPYWTGFRVRPVQIEFWRDRPFRLHDRLVFKREQPEDPWIKTRLYP